MGKKSRMEKMKKKKRSSLLHWGNTNSTVFKLDRASGKWDTPTYVQSFKTNWPTQPV